jgi:hypothetical protein
MCYYLPERQRLPHALVSRACGFVDRELCGAWRQAQLEPTAESVLLMLLPAVWTFWPWELACS